MKTFICLPTWLLYRIVLVHILPTGHPWKGQKYTPREWATGATPYTVQTALGIWCCSLPLAFILWHLSHG